MTWFCPIVDRRGTFIITDQTFGLEDFDLTVGRVEEFGDVITPVRVGVNLDAKRDPLFAAVLLGSELGGEAVDLDKDARLLRRVP